MNSKRTEIRIGGLTAMQADTVTSTFRSESPFAMIRPIPSSLMKCSEGKVTELVNDAIREYLRRRPRDIRLERPDAGQQITDLIREEGLELRGQAALDVHNAVQAFRNTGFTSASAWKRERWGCGQEPSMKPRVSVSADAPPPGSIAVTVLLETEDGVPSGIARKLSSLYPDAVVTQSHACRKNVRDAGKITYRSGKVIARFCPDPLDLDQWTEDIYEKFNTEGDKKNG